MAPLIAALICSIVTFYPLKFSAALPGAPPQPEAKIAGTITMRNGEVMNVRTADGKIVEVVLNPDTKIEKPEGAVGFREKRLDVTALAPGLNVVAQGMQYENEQLVAKIVTLSRQSLQSATAASSAASPGPRDTNLADYSVKATYDAHFEAGSALLSQIDKTALLHLAIGATELSAYIIQVQGFADVPGNNAYDRQFEPRPRRSSHRLLGEGRDCSCHAHRCSWSFGSASPSGYERTCRRQSPEPACGGQAAAA